MAYEKYAAEGFVVLSVSVQESKTAVSEFIARHQLNYPFLLDTEGDVSRLYNVYTTPTTYFVNAEGIITDILPGVVTQSWLEKNLLASLPEDQ